MNQSIFDLVHNFKFTPQDAKANQKFIEIEQSTAKILPQGFFTLSALSHHQQMSNTRLYHLMKTIPKGVMHHIHYFCTDDRKFYENHIVNDSRIYLTSDLKQFKIGTKDQAKQQKWVSMQQGKNIHGRQQWLDIIVKLTCFTKQQYDKASFKQKQMWPQFQKKIITPLHIFFVRDIFQKYSRHVFEKYIKNGYQRIQIRTNFDRIKQYDSQGNLVQIYPIQKCWQFYDKAIKQINKQYPHFNVGYISSGFKMLSDQANYQIMKMVCQPNWDKLCGFDFVQEQDKYDNLLRYDKIIQKIYQDYPQCSHVKKVYHAGETSCHLTQNIDIAVKAGSVRIGHGINILQRVEFLQYCRNVCFQKNPLSNMILGYKKDLREASAPILLGLGIPVSINPDDPGKFGLQDSTYDFFISALSYNWSLKHLKLIGYHSINHSLCEQDQKNKMIVYFQKIWNEWVKQLISEDQVQMTQDEQLFDKYLDCSFDEVQKKANKKYIQIRDRENNKQNEKIYKLQYLSKKQIEKSQFYNIFATMPKGILQGCDFYAQHSLVFFQNITNECGSQYVSQIIKNILQQQHNYQLKQIYFNKLVSSELSNNQLISLLCQLTAFQNINNISQYHKNKFLQSIKNKYINLTTLLQDQKIQEIYISNMLTSIFTSYQAVELRIRPCFQQNPNINNLLSKTLQLLSKINKAINIINEKQNKQFDYNIILIGSLDFKQQTHQIFNEICKNKTNHIKAFDLIHFVQYQILLNTKYAQIAKQQNNHLLSIIQQYYQQQYINLFLANSFLFDDDQIKNAIQISVPRISTITGRLTPQSLNLSKIIAIQMNPISSMSFGGVQDLRKSLIPVLLGLGVPVTINTQNSGFFLMNSTLQFTMCAQSFNWNLKHIKKALINSINYSLNSYGLKLKIKKQFLNKWNKWIQKLSMIQL